MPGGRPATRRIPREPSIRLVGGVLPGLLPDGDRRRPHHHPVGADARLEGARADSGLFCRAGAERELIGHSWISVGRARRHFQGQLLLVRNNAAPAALPEWMVPARIGWSPGAGSPDRRSSERRPTGRRGRVSRTDRHPLCPALTFAGTAGHVPGRRHFGSRTSGRAVQPMAVTTKTEPHGLINSGRGRPVTITRSPSLSAAVPGPVRAYRRKGVCSTRQLGRNPSMITPDTVSCADALGEGETRPLGSAAGTDPGVPEAGPGEVESGVAAVDSDPVAAPAPAPAEPGAVAALLDPVDPVGPAAPFEAGAPHAAAPTSSTTRARMPTSVRTLICPTIRLSATIRPRRSQRAEPLHARFDRVGENCRNTLSSRNYPMFRQPLRSVLSAAKLPPSAV